jgi:hypothetical protein
MRLSFIRMMRCTAASTRARNSLSLRYFSWKKRIVSSMAWNC